MAKFEDSVGYVMSNEGLGSDHPNDPGGVTYWGISIRFLESVGEAGDIDKDGDVDADDVRALRRVDAIVFYAERFWKPLSLDRLRSQAVATRVLDIAVNAGNTRAVKVLQKAVNSMTDEGMRLKVDGKLGPKTRGAANSLDDVELMAALREKHAAFYKAIAKRNPALEVFLNGWLKRAGK
jgi:lysozyme family protein